ncbi:uncharacterized protein [Dermacentor albipictus]|uniref:uncharacterized protein isoform X2 n=1 Tax=Dermacentor albipictus TaxID=60249 RepID=UPI0038FCA51C
MVLTSRQRRTKHPGVHTEGIARFTMLVWSQASSPCQRAVRKLKNRCKSSGPQILMGRRIIRYAIFQTCGLRLQPQVMQSLSRMGLKQLADLKKTLASLHWSVDNKLPEFFAFVQPLLNGMEITEEQHRKQSKQLRHELIHFLDAGLDKARYKKTRPY